MPFIVHNPEAGFKRLIRAFLKSKQKSNFTAENAKNAEKSIKNVRVNSRMNTSHAKTQSRKAVFRAYFLATWRLCVKTFVFTLLLMITEKHKNLGGLSVLCGKYPPWLYFKKVGFKTTGHCST